MKKSKKALAGILAVIMIFTSLAFSYSAFATTFLEISLNKIYSGNINGGGDKIWYSYTPVESGTYSLISYSTRMTEAHLFTMNDKGNGLFDYNGLAYAPANDPNYMDCYSYYDEATSKTYYHYETSFILTYHLEAGTTYYYRAGYPYNSTASGTINVLLRQDSVDSDIKTLTSISAVCSAELERYNDGSWQIDSNGDRYYNYNVSKVIQNTTVTLHYSDGTTSSAKGADEIDGYRIMYSQNQHINHWYESTAPEYTRNVMTVSVMDISCDYDVTVEVGVFYNVQGVVLDYTDGMPIEDANIYYKNILLATTDAQGRFNLSYAYGTYYLRLDCDGAFTREFMLTITKNSASNDHTSTPITLLTGDYVRDGVINGKDIVHIYKRLSGEKREREMAKFNSQLGLRNNADLYENLCL